MVTQMRLKWRLTELIFGLVVLLLSLLITQVNLLFPMQEHQTQNLESPLTQIKGGSYYRENISTGFMPDMIHFEPWPTPDPS
jgi:hypothetical protein